MKVRNVLVALAFVAISACVFAQPGFAISMADSQTGIGQLVHPTLDSSCTNQPGTTCPKPSRIHPLTPCPDYCDPYQFQCSQDNVSYGNIGYSNGHHWQAVLYISNSCGGAWTRLHEVDGSGDALVQPASAGCISTYGQYISGGGTRNQLCNVYDGAWNNVSGGLYNDQAQVYIVTGNGQKLLVSIQSYSGHCC